MIDHHKANNNSNNNNSSSNIIKSIQKEQKIEIKNKIKMDILGFQILHKLQVET